MDNSQLIQREDLVLFSKMSNALWSNPQHSEISALEIFSAVSLLDLTPSRVMEKASRALLDRAKKGGAALNSQVNLNVLSSQFFRLSIEERLVLVALHQGRWSYSKLATILEVSSENIEELAWRARLQCALSSGYPAAPTHSGPNCPEYQPWRPWSQRYLDEEMGSGNDRFFIQRHVLTCTSCQACLTRCRQIYAQVGKEVADHVGRSDFTEALEQVARQGMLQRFPSKRTFKESLVLFVSRREVRWALFLFFTFLGFHVFRR